MIVMGNRNYYYPKRQSKIGEKIPYFFKYGIFMWVHIFMWVDNTPDFN